MSICDYTNDEGIVDSDGLGDASADFRNGEIGSDLLGDVSAAFRDGTPVDGCSEPDRSTLDISSPTTRLVGSRTVEVTAELTNRVESGSGERLDGGVDVTVNGDRRETFPYVLNAGESAVIETTISDLPTGDVTICVE